MGPPAQGRHLLDLAIADFLHPLGGLEDRLNVFSGKVLDPEDVAADHRLPPFFPVCLEDGELERAHARRAVRVLDLNAGSNSSAVNTTLSLGWVGMFLPT